MPVPSLAQFKTSTRLEASGLRRGKLRDIRSASIKPIDDDLRAYDAVRNTPNLGKRSQALSTLLSECARWLKAKQAKVSTNSTARRLAITNLATEAFNELKTINRASGTDFYNLNKSITTGGQVNYQRKGLSAGYSNERKMYLANNKTSSPVAAGFVHAGMANLPHTGFGRNFDMAAEAQLVLNKPFSSLTEQDFALIARGYADSIGGNTTPDLVHFSNKAERSGQLMVVYQGYNADFENINGQAFDTQDEPAYMYAMDEYGTLYASKPTGLAHGTNYWNHSSFNAGKDVVCAGMIQIHNGVLHHVDNSSGHYKPSRQHLFEMLTILQGEGISLAAANISIYQPAPVANHTDIHTTTAANFLLNVNFVDHHAVRIQN